MNKIFNYIFQKKKTAVGFAIIYTAVIFIACLMPSNKVPKVNVPMMDKWVHFLAFGGFAFVWGCTLRKINFFSLFLIVIISCLTGWLIELLQASGITRGRSYENMDIVADSIGGFMGVLVFWILYKFSTHSSYTVKEKSE